MPVDLDEATLKTTIDENNIVFVDFWAPWCGPCRFFAPVYEEAAKEHTDVVFGKVNTEEHQSLAGAFQIRSIPTLMVFREQILIFNQPGAMSKPDFDNLILAVKGLDMDAVRKEIEEQDKPKSE